MTGDRWHDAVVRLVGSYARKGLTDGEVHTLSGPLTMAGYTLDDTRREVQAAINGARRKGWDRSKPDSRSEPPPRQDGNSGPEPEPDAHAYREMTSEEEDQIPARAFKAWERKDLPAIPRPQFVYPDFYARGFTSLTIAAPKVGKSMLALAEAVDMATGRRFLTGVKQAPQRVFYYNAEDDQPTLDARVAALLSAYGIDQDEIIGRLWAVSGIDEKAFYFIGGTKEPSINERLFIGFRKFVLANQIDGSIFDPLQDLSIVPETNEVLRLPGQRVRLLATTCQMAVGLIHRTRKVALGFTPTINDLRGGSALRGTAHFSRILASNQRRRPSRPAWTLISATSASETSRVP